MILSSGGAMGGAVAAAVSRRKFKSVAYIILNDLSPTQRKTLATTVTVSMIWKTFRNT